MRWKRMMLLAAACWSKRGASRQVSRCLCPGRLRRSRAASGASCGCACGVRTARPQRGANRRRSRPGCWRLAIGPRGLSRRIGTKTRRAHSRVPLLRREFDAATPECGGRGCTSPPWASTRRRSTACRWAITSWRPAGPATSTACATRPSTSPRCCAKGATPSARCWATAGSAAGLGFGGGRRNIYGDRLALLAQLEIEYADGTADAHRQRRNAGAPRRARSWPATSTTARPTTPGLERRLVARRATTTATGRACAVWSGI